MSRRRFLVPAFDGDRAVLEGDEAHHLARVLRAQPGQEFELTDGEVVRVGRIQSVKGDRVEFALQDICNVGPVKALPLVLQVSLVKFTRFEWILEKAAEFGVTRIVPLKASRSNGHLARAAAGKAERWHKILHGATQQSRRVAPPELAEPIGSEEAFASSANSANVVKLVLSEAAGAPLLKHHLRQGAGLSSAIQSAMLAIGPEGGWADAELRSADEAGYVAVSLGATILRTETACLAALAILSHEMSGDPDPENTFEI